MFWSNLPFNKDSNASDLNLKVFCQVKIVLYSTNIGKFECVPIWGFIYVAFLYY